MKTELPHPTSNRLKNLPFLENGDRLTRSKFERRDAAASHIKKAELIERKGLLWNYEPPSLLPTLRPRKSGPNKRVHQKSANSQYE